MSGMRRHKRYFVQLLACILKSGMKTEGLSQDLGGVNYQYEKSGIEERVEGGELHH